MSTYVLALKKHLADYKTAHLGIVEEGTWRGKQCSHILPKNLQELNIMETIRTKFWEYASQTKPQLHPDFHHLNSSQAMCFNLFYPFLQAEAGESGWLEALLGFGDDRISQFRFEQIVDRREATNFDLVLTLRSGRTVFMETKLSEPGFAGKEPDANSYRRLRDLYPKRLQSKVLPKCLDPDFFFDNYQLLRNISYAEKDGSKISYLVVPKANETFGDVPQVLDEILLPEIRPYVQLRYIEDLVAAIQGFSVEKTSFLQEPFRLFSESM